MPDLDSSNLHYREAKRLMDTPAPDGNHIRAYSGSEREVIRQNILRQAQIHASLYVGEQVETLTGVLAEATEALRQRDLTHEQYG